MWLAGALRGDPASSTRTVRRARDRTRAADSPAAPPPMIATSYWLMDPPWSGASSRPTNVAVPGKPESDEPHGRNCAGPGDEREHRDGARPGGSTSEAGPDATTGDADGGRGDDRHLQEHAVPARERAEAPHPGTAPHPLAGLSGAARRP